MDPQHTVYTSGASNGLIDLAMSVTIASRHLLGLVGLQDVRG